MTEYKKILAELIENKTTWRDLKTELSRYNVHDSDTGKKDTRAGKIFEVFTKHYFQTSPIEKDNYKNVWMFEEIPTDVRNKLDFGNVDYGVDLLLEDTESQYFAVQCKFKNDEKSTLNWTKDKIANLYGFCPKADGYIVFSNAADLDNTSKTRYDKFTFYSVADLQEIESEVFQNIHNQLKNKGEIKREIYSPLPHQKKAVADCVEFFEIEKRGQLILPCGAGKTYVALWIKESLKCTNTLVLVPSLALLRQLKNEWAKHRTNPYKYICVCSEKDIDKNNVDTIVTHTYEVDVNVTTDSSEIKLFLNKEYPDKVIFSTYHSLHAIADAIENSDFEFDYIFCDEAHKTAGVRKNKFSLVHDNNKIPSKRRLYATATPRIVKESLKKKLGDDLKYAYDMNDPEIFGYEFHRMSFKEAIEAKPEPILVDYKIVAIGVNNEELHEYIEKRNYVDSNVSIDEVANNYALEHVMNKYNANHALSFHSRVKLANEFSIRHHNLFNEVETFAVSGDQPTSQRNIVLDDFKHAQKAIVSNARCLTEGISVPAIDLVYFCDPKNSKVDIVQAVGRALRKKEGKERGYVVIPIYHTKQDEIETSITDSSFKNLIQVIRSLCDQDERLQDEINSLAFGKGKRKSNRIDITSTNFSEEQDILLLDGFEEKLKNSLFDQIIDKTSNNWDLWFLEFKGWLNDNKNEYPTAETNQELYSWVSQQRNRKKCGNLKNEEIRKLNSINFIWDYQEWKWYSMYYQLIDYSRENKFEPHKGDNVELAKWFIVQKSQIKNGMLSDDRQNLLTKVSFIGTFKDKKWYDNFEEYKNYALENEFEPDEKLFPDLAKWINSQKTQLRLNKFDDEKQKLFLSIELKSPVEKKWHEFYSKLVDFRLDFPNKWPQYNKDKSDSEENKLNGFCQAMRTKFRENSLSNYWFDKMSSISFNFEGHLANWYAKFEEYYKLVESEKSVSVYNIGQTAYAWISLQIKKDDNSQLTKKQSEDLSKIRSYFKSWEQQFESVKKWTIKNGKLPSRTTQKDFHSWLGSQRAVFKKGNLSEPQIEKLSSISFDLEGKGKEVNEQKWLNYFEQLKIFIEENNRYPGPTHEKDLYIWVQSQRAAKAGNLRNRNPLSNERVDLLNSINFSWIGLGALNQPWEDSFVEFKTHITLSGKLVLPSTIEGKRNILYTWWTNQKNAFVNGELDIDKVNAFKSVGIDLSFEKNNSKRDGFTKWSNRLREIVEFKNETGNLPKAGKDKLESNLYQSLARTKRAYIKGELSDKQLDLIKELEIDME